VSCFTSTATGAFSSCRAHAGTLDLSLLRRVGLLTFLLLLFFGVSAGRATATVPRYSVTDLGTLGGNLTVPQGLNKFGHATGYANKDATAVYYAYLWNGTTLKQACTSSFAGARGINSFDKMVGTIVTTAKIKGQNYTYYHVGICQGTTQTDFGTGPAGCTAAHAWAINDSDAMTVTCGINGGPAYVFKNGVYTSIGTFGGSTNFPWAINSNGVVAGRSDTTSGTASAYFYDGTLHMISTLPICAGSTPWGEAKGINDLADVVGDWCGDAFFYANSQATDLGPGAAKGINNKGQIVGSEAERAVVYDWQNGLWVDLNSLASPIPQGIVLEDAVAINDGGQILVLALVPTPPGTPLSGLHQYSYLLNPLGQLSTAAPSNTGLGAPQVSGLPISGDLFTATHGNWSGVTPTYAYQWLRCDTSGANCADISGATGSTYTPQSADLGSTVRVRVTASNEYGSSTAQSAATDVIQTALDAFRPQLWYDSQETYRADAAGELTDNCWTDSSGSPHINVLYNSSGSLIASACDSLNLSYLGRYYPSGNQAQSTDYIAEYSDQAGDFQRLHAMAQYGNRVYGRVRTYPDGESILQYWFWYYNQPNFIGAFNNWGGHEGDWEGIQVHLDPNGNPVDATYYQHDGGERCGWNLVTANGTHPVDFVAVKSHASYFTTGFHDDGTDSADGGGEVVTPSVDAISDTSPEWLFWPGMWGGSTSSALWYQTSPTGPGEKQAQWDDPLRWQGQSNISACSVPSSMRMLQSSHASDRVTAKATVPAPRVRAHRVGKRAIVSYCFATVPTSRKRRPAVMLVSVQSANKHVPPYTTQSRAHLPCGRVTQPIGLGRAPFHVLVSAWSRAGARSRVVTVPLR
jgi:hypothetical protein